MEGEGGAATALLEDFPFEDEEEDATGTLGLRERERVVDDLEAEEVDVEDEETDEAAVSLLELAAAEVEVVAEVLVEELALPPVLILRVPFCSACARSFVKSLVVAWRW